MFFFLPTWVFWVGLSWVWVFFAFENKLKRNKNVGDIEKRAPPRRWNKRTANFFEKTGVLGTIPASWVGKLIEKKMHLGVDFFGNSAILFSVMRDRIEIEEIFEADPQARAEFDTVCDEWQNDAIEAQDADAEWIRANTKLVNVSEK